MTLCTSLAWIGTLLGLVGSLAVGAAPPIRDPTAWPIQAGVLMAEAATDPEGAEAALYRLLDALPSPPFDPATHAMLERLQDWPVYQTHADPERHGRQVPRFPVAWAARRGLRLQALHDSTRRAQAGWVRGMDTYVQGLRADAVPGPWLELLQVPGRCADPHLQSALAGCASTHRPCADAVLICAAQVDHHLLRSALRQAEPARMVMQAQRSDWPSAVAVAALPGVATQRQLRHASKGWSSAELDLLGDPLRGADAAMALAERLDAQGLQALHTVFMQPHSSTLLRQRILLVLRLTPLPHAAAQQQAWLQALGTADPELQRSVASW